MSRFFNKHELLNIMLIILLLGMNSFTEISISFISYDDKRDYFGFIMALGFVLLDIHMYSMLVNLKPSLDVVYKASKKISLDCESDSNQQIKDDMEKIKYIGKSCDLPMSDAGGVLSKKIVVGFVMVVIFMIITTSIALGGSDPNSNSLKMRMLLSIPLILLGGGIIKIATEF